MANKTLTFKADLLPNSNLGYSLGSNNKQWTIYGAFKGNADTATKLSNTPNNTTTFLRGDNTWTNALLGPLGVNRTPEYTLDISGNARATGEFYTQSSFYARYHLIQWYNNNWWTTVSNHDNGDIGYNAAGGGVYLGWDNTTHTVIGTTQSWKHWVDTNHTIAISRNPVADPHSGAAIEVREVNEVGANQSDEAYCPRIGFHWSGRNAAWLGLLSDGWFKLGRENNSYYGLKLQDLWANGNITVNVSNTTGGGIILSDDGDIVDLNDGYCSMRFSGGIQITRGNRTGGQAIILSSGGSIYQNRSDTGNTYATLRNDNNGNLVLCGMGNGVYLGWDSCNEIFIGPSTNGWKQKNDVNHIMITSRTYGINPWGGAALEVREVAEVNGSQSDWGYAPRIGFHWAGRVAQTIGLESDGVLRFRIQDNGNLSTIQAGAVWGAVYNDYAEMRNVPEVQKLMKPKQPLKNYEKPKREIPMAGKCVREVGDDTMALSTKRLQKGCKIISDTFGFNIGETEDAKTPVAVCGRVLAYPYEDREEYRNHIGDFVCSGPEGTISIMTDEEALTQPWCIIGTISAVPDYERWGEDNVLVDGRIWIYVR